VVARRKWAPARFQDATDGTSFPTPKPDARDIPGVGSGTPARADPFFLFGTRALLSSSRFNRGAGFYLDASEILLARAEVPVAAAGCARIVGPGNCLPVFALGWRVLAAAGQD